MNPFASRACGNRSSGMSGTAPTLVELEHVLVPAPAAREAPHMSIGISEEHVELARSLREWAASLGGRQVVRDADGDADATFADTWKACVEMGVATIGLPEERGGGGGSVLDQAVALEACAHELVPGPLLSTAVAALVAHEIGRGAAVAVTWPSGLVGDLAGATHLLTPDGSLAELESARPAL